METRFTRFLQHLSRWSVYLIIFCVPLFWLPLTPDAFELPKYFLLYALVLLGLLAFLLHAVYLKKITIRRSPLDIPLLAVWLVFLVSSLLSETRLTSFFGDFSFLGLSFLSFSTLLLFYFLVIQCISSVKQVFVILKLLLISSVITALYTLITHTGVLGLAHLSVPAILPLNVVQNAQTAFGVYMVVVGLLAAAVFSFRKRNRWLDALALVVFLLAVGILVLLGSAVVWILFALGLSVLVVFFLTYLSEARSWWSTVIFSTIVLCLVFIFLGSPRLFDVPLNTETALPLVTSWKITVASARDSVRHILVGSGPETYLHIFSKYRPAEFNTSPFWNLRFYQPYNGLLMFITTVGLLGTFIFAAIICIILGCIFATWLRQIADLKRRSREGEDGARETNVNSPLLFWAVAGSWLILLAAFCVINFSSVHWMLFWLFSALIVVLHGHFTKTLLPQKSFSLKTTPQYALATSFGFIVVFSSIIILSIYLGRFYVAEVWYGRSFSVPLNQKSTFINRAIELNPQRPIFYSTLAEVFAENARTITANNGDANQALQAVALAIQAAERSTALAPFELTGWEHLAVLYQNAKAFVPEAEGWLLKTLDTMVALEPTNPTFYVQRASAKAAATDSDGAKADLQKAIQLKQDFLPAYIQLAHLAQKPKDSDVLIPLVEPALQYGQLNPEFLVALGLLYYNRSAGEDVVVAEKYFRRAVSLAPQYSDALFALAVLDEQRGSRVEALLLYKQLLSLNPGTKQLIQKINSLETPAVVEKIRKGSR